MTPRGAPRALRRPGCSGRGERSAGTERRPRRARRARPRRASRRAGCLSRRRSPCPVVLQRPAFSPRSGRARPGRGAGLGARALRRVDSQLGGQPPGGDPAVGEPRAHAVRGSRPGAGGQVRASGGPCCLPRARGGIEDELGDRLCADRGLGAAGLRRARRRASLGRSRDRHAAGRARPRWLRGRTMPRRSSHVPLRSTTVGSTPFASAALEPI